MTQRRDADDRAWFPAVEDKLVIVTGAAQGQGAAEVRQLVASGARVIAVDVATEAVEDLAGARYERLDVTDASGWAELVSSLPDPVDALVNNAGVTWRDGLLDVRPQDMERVYRINVVGPLLGIQHCAPRMGAGASVVNVGSVAALTAHSPVAYTASKWALRGLSKVAALELGPRGIRVNTVHPGYIETPMTASAAPTFRAANVAETPLGRTGTVDEVAALVTFLVSDRSSYLSGAEIPVDGGMTSHGGVKSIADARRRPSVAAHQPR